MEIEQGMGGGSLAYPLARSQAAQNHTDVDVRAVPDTYGVVFAIARTVRDRYVERQVDYWDENRCGLRMDGKGKSEVGQGVAGDGDAEAWQRVGGECDG